MLSENDDTEREADSVDGADKKDVVEATNKRDGQQNEGKVGQRQPLSKNIPKQTMLSENDDTGREGDSVDGTDKKDMVE
eukprot:CAMPEP_0185725506 /NCGR_PEP_ID=MMETSP1171-20130828/1755_1 /TAXON_ID=374046 /ORGANISM="Helicotheca tamensis, Strain CCMP826" /LENGTH=78 /DNA_ID=CAMNT_0028393651 /DNA_START=9 /DNA_END=242 /DNA_ORIENTATION=+